MRPPRRNKINIKIMTVSVGRGGLWFSMVTKVSRIFHFVLGRCCLAGAVFNVNTWTFAEKHCSITVKQLITNLRRYLWITCLNKALFMLYFTWHYWNVYTFSRLNHLIFFLKNKKKKTVKLRKQKLYRYYTTAVLMCTLSSTNLSIFRTFFSFVLKHVSSYTWNGIKRFIHIEGTKNRWTILRQYRIMETIKLLYQCSRLLFCYN